MDANRRPRGADLGDHWVQRLLGGVILAQLGPLAMLSLIGGSLADTIDRRKLLLATQLWQMAWTAVLAAMVWDGNIDRWTLLGLVFIIGIAKESTRRSSRRSCPPWLEDGTSQRPSRC